MALLLTGAAALSTAGSARSRHTCKSLSAGSGVAGLSHLLALAHGAEPISVPLTAAEGELLALLQVGVVVELETQSHISTSLADSLVY